MTITKKEIQLIKKDTVILGHEEKIVEDVIERYNEDTHTQKRKNDCTHSLHKS